MQPIKQINAINRCLGISLTGLAVLVLGFIFAPTLISEASATNARTSINWSPVSLTLDPDYGNGTPGSAGHGDINLNFVAPTSVTGNNKGTMRVTKKTIAVSTSGQYYAVYLQTGSSNNQLSHSSASTTLAINSVSGTWTNPVAFTGRGWGYAVPGSPITNGFTSDGTTLATYTGLPLDTDMTYASDSHYNTGKWAAVPTNTTVAQQIWKATTTNPLGLGEYESGGDTITGDTANNKFDIYYAAMADNDLIAGEYKNTIVYTAIASSGNLDNVSNNIGRNKAYVTGGDIETLTFDLAMSIPSLTASDVKVYLVPHATTNANGYTTSGLTTTYQCSSITNFSISNGQAKLDCTIPTNPTGATEGGATRAGEWDFWINLPTYNYNYVSRYVDDNNVEVGAITYAGLQTKKRNGTDPVITEIQEMTPSVCKNTNKWGTGLGTNARLYNYTGSGTTLFSGVPTYSATVNQTTGGDLGLGSFALTDNRDNKLYLVRRLADGNCWMVQNLDLNLADFAGTKNLTVGNTDLNSSTALSRGYYDPQEKLLADSGKATVAEALLEKYGFAQTVQFQSGDQRNTDVEPQYSWSSTSNTGSGNSATTTLGTTVYNSADAAYARSYDNVTYGYVPTNQTDGSQTNTIGNLTARSDSDGLNNYKTSGWVSAYANQYVGDYYNWYAATAESGTFAQSSGDAEDSICPKGWQLPQNDGDASGSKSWYGLIVGAYKQNTNNGDGSSGSVTISDSEVNIKKFPLSLVRSGNYDWAYGNLNHRGSYGSFWSSTPYAVTATRSLRFWSGTLYPRNGDNKTGGFTVRCVARD